MSPIWNLFKANWKIFYRNRSAFFWVLAIPAGIYAGLSLLPVQRLVGDTGVPYSSFLLPGLIAMAIMQGGIYGLAYWFVDLRARGVMKRFAVTPVSKLQFISGVLLSRILVMFIQLIILCLVGVVFFGAIFNASLQNLVLIVLFTFLGGSTFLLFGLLIATFADTYEAAAPLTAMIGLSMTFLGNIFYPITIMPEALQWAAKALPMTYFAHGMRANFIQTNPLSLVGMDVLVLLVWLAVITGLVIWRFRLEE